MNYSEELKQMETSITNIQAQLIAKKQSIESELEKRKKIEEECKSKLGISLSEVPEKIKTLTKELEEGFEALKKERDEIERKFEKFNK